MKFSQMEYQRPNVDEMIEQYKQITELVSRSKFFSSVTRVCGFFHFYAKKRNGEKPFDSSPPSLFL